MTAEQRETLLDRLMDTIKRLHPLEGECVADSEGQSCCLDEEHPGYGPLLGTLLETIEDVLTEQGVDA